MFGEEKEAPQTKVASYGAAKQTGTDRYAQSAQRKEEEVTVNKTYFDLGDEYIIENVSSTEKVEEEGTKDEHFGLEQKREKLQEQAQERIRRLKGLNQNSTMSSDSFKEKLDVPAYLRKKISLQDIPHSSEQNISKYNLNDDSQILGNNKFLHDNVD